MIFSSIKISSPELTNRKTGEQGIRTWSGSSRSMYLCSLRIGSGWTTLAGSNRNGWKPTNVTTISKTHWSILWWENCARDRSQCAWVGVVENQDKNLISVLRRKPANKIVFRHRHNDCSRNSLVLWVVGLALAEPDGDELEQVWKDFLAVSAISCRRDSPVSIQSDRPSFDVRFDENEIVSRLLRCCSLRVTTPSKWYGC